MNIGETLKTRKIVSLLGSGYDYWVIQYTTDNLRSLFMEIAEGEFYALENQLVLSAPTVRKLIRSMWTGRWA